MLIDWFTVSAQIVNFLVLVWLLKRYLFRPILRAIDAREKDIESCRAAAKAETEKARQEREECRQETERLDHQRSSVLAEARDEARKERARLLEAAEREAAELRATRQKELASEMAERRDELLRLARREIIEGTRKLVSDLASAQLEQSVVDVFLKRLDELAAAPPIRSSQGDKACQSIRVRSAFPLSSAQQQRITEELRRKFSTSTAPSFEVDQDLVLGLELTVGDERIGWNADGYLTAFQHQLDALARANGKEHRA